MILALVGAALFAVLRLLARARRRVVTGSSSPDPAAVITPALGWRRDPMEKAPRDRGAL